VLARRTLAVASRREVYPSEAALLGPGMVVVSCTAGAMSETVELAMGEAALTGFLAWLESAPPGSYPPKPLRPEGATARRRASTARRRGWHWPGGPG